MKFLDTLNAELEKIENEYAHGNASGIPCRYPKTCAFSFDSIERLPTIALNPHTPGFLRRLADMLEEYI
jgi:hypothetical protein